MCSSWIPISSLIELILQNNEKKVDMAYFKELCTEYYRSDDPGALGNFINGKLDFSDWTKQ